MAATVTARTSAPARRAPARRRAPATGEPAARKPAARTAAPGKRRRSGHTPITGFVPVAAAAGAVGGIADSGLFVWLTRGRLWIGLLGTLLVGIVGLNVMALSFSASSSNAGQAADTLKRENSALRAQIAGKLSNTEIQGVAAKLGLVMPPAGSIGYLDSSADDAATAAKRLRDGELTAGVSADAAPVEAAIPAEAGTVEAPAVEAPAAETEAVDTAPAETAPAETAPVETAPVVPTETAPAEAAPAVAETTAAGGGVGAP